MVGTCLFSSFKVADPHIQESLVESACQWQIVKFILRREPWGLIVIYKPRGADDSQGWSMVAFKLNEDFENASVQVCFGLLIC